VYRLGIRCAAALAVACLIAMAAPQGAAKQKQPKDQGEFDIYNEVIKDVSTNNFTKALTDLDTWERKYPDSDYKDDREVLYVQAYNGAKQPAKALDAAGPLVGRDLDAVFTDPVSGPQQVVKVMFTAALAIQQVPNPTPDELATGSKAAQMLLDYNRKPSNVSDDDWAKARAQLQAVAKAALTATALKPGTAAMETHDYAGAEAAFEQALQQYPDSGQVAYELGASELAQQSTNPAKVPAGIYEIARAVALDPAKGGLADAAARSQVDAYLKKIYTSYHGSEEGLDALKQQALARPTPAADFTLKSQAEMDGARRDLFAKEHPELALWLTIKAALTGANGAQYFETQLKDTAVPKLKGVLVDAKPACKPKELLVAVPMPDAKPPYTAEIALKLDAPLTGKPPANAEFSWEGVPASFTKDPFLLTMNAEKAKLTDLTTEPCTAAPARKPASKKP
jgi:outer membrane protein assembly factor BamD (BamD/ComL family)